MTKWQIQPVWQVSSCKTSVLVQYELRYFSRAVLASAPHISEGRLIRDPSSDDVRSGRFLTRISVGLGILRQAIAIAVVVKTTSALDQRHAQFILLCTAPLNLLTPTDPKLAHKRFSN
jgi:hypothetical protein